MKRAIYLILLLILLSAMLVGCWTPEGTTMMKEATVKWSIIYYYDEVHEVCIWKVGSAFSDDIFILPASQVKNPELPIERE